MDRTGKIAWLIMAAAAAVIGIAAILPPGGWIVRRQLEWEFRNPPSIAWISNEVGMRSPDGSSVDRPTLQIADMARQHPQDLPLQIAAASSPRLRVEAVEGLADRSPSNPALTAAILRAFLLTRRMDLQSVEDALPQIPSAGLDKYPIPKRVPPSAADAVEFLKRSEQGQREDPGNGYFVVMRAIALMAQHQTAPALSTLSGVSRCSGWRDYDQVPAAGQWEAVQTGFDDHRATLHGLVVASALMPEYTVMRSLGRIAVAQAIHLELHGDARGGVAIRHSVMACGALMRSGADSVIAALVGGALVQMAAGHPGGAPNEVARDQASTERRTQLRLAAYQRFLLGHGFRQESEWAAREFAASEAARRILKAPDAGSALSLNSIARRTGWWTIGEALLFAILCLLVMGAVSGLLLLDDGERPGRAAIGWGRVAVLLPAAALVLLFGMRSHWPALLGTEGVLVGELLPTVPGTGLPHGIGLLGILILNPAPVQGITVALLDLAAPVLALVIAGIAALFMRGGTCRAALRAMRIVAPAMALCLLCGYLYVLAHTAGVESRANREIDAFSANEPQSVSRLVGISWPPR